MALNDYLIAHLGAIEKICKKYGVRRLYAYGSVTSDNFDIENSDVDLQVEIDEADPILKGEALMNLWDELEALFSRKVDLLTDQPIKNPYFRKSVEDTKQLIYDGQSEEVSI